MNTVKRMLLCIVFCYANFFTQAQITNHLFSFDSDSTFNEINWLCDASKFVHESGKLRSNNGTINDTFGLSFQIQKRVLTEWSVELDLGISTSSANYVDVYFWSSSACLFDAQYACFVRIGDTKDAIVLYNVYEGTRTQLNTSDNGITHSLSGRLVMFVDSIGIGKLTFYSDAGKKVFSADSLHVNRVDSFSYTGISIRQSTQSFHNKHYFDNFYYGPPRKDSLPPKVDNIQVINDSILQLHVNERISSEDLKPTNFMVQPDRKIPTFVRLIEDTLRLYFMTKFETGSYLLTISQLSDSFGNAMRDVQIPFEHILFDFEGRHDVVISEIYADYSPTVGLPMHEYVELTNTSGKTLDLYGWELTDGNRRNFLPSYVLWPDSTVILCDVNSIDAFLPKMNVLGVTNLIGLNNSGDSLWLKGVNGEMIHEVFYSSDWHQPTWKQVGGWSLEMIDVNRPCKQSENWTSSVHPTGGTPGQMNSVKAALEDRNPPKVMLVETHKRSVEIVFNESILSSDIEIKDDPVPNISIGEFTLPTNNTMQVVFDEDLDIGVLYSMHIYGIEDCFGNIADEILVTFGIGKKPANGDVLINEVMYDVSESCVEYIELCNVSEQLLDFTDLHFAVKDSSNEWKHLYPIRTSSLPCKSQNYYAICADSIRLKDCKTNAVHIIQSDKLPTLVNGSGHVGLTTIYGDVVDTFTYSDAFHFPLLSETKDVSLERLKPQLSERNWLSASQHHNFGTPGFENSHIVKETPDLNTLTIQTDPVSPNFDGYNDQLIVAVTVSNENVAHLRIYDLVGRLVAFPVNTNLIAGTSNFVWDCLDKHGRIVTPGIYVADFEAIDLVGKKTRDRSVFTVTW